MQNTKKKNKKTTEWDTVQKILYCLNWTCVCTFCFELWLKMLGLQDHAN